MKIQSFVSALAALILVGCDRALPTYLPEAQKVLAGFDLTATDSTAPAGAAVTLTVVVGDNDGDPKPGIRVTWTVHAVGRGAMGPQTDLLYPIPNLLTQPSTTDLRGRASVEIAIPFGATFRVLARSNDLALQDTVRLQASRSADSAVVIGSLPPLLPTGRFLMRAVPVGDRIYLLGGARGASTFAGELMEKMFVYHRVLETWSTAPQPPGFRLDPGTVPALGAALDDGLHAIVGTSHFVWDTLQNSWRPRASAPNAPEHGVLERIGNQLYLVSSSGDLSTYDPATDQWRVGRPLGRPAAFALGLVRDGKLFVVGGSDGAGFSSWQPSGPLHRYDPMTNTWTELAPMPFGRTSFFGWPTDAGFCVSGGAFLTYRGSQQLSETYCYDRARNRWEFAGDGIGGFGMAGVAIGGDVYVFGGATIDANAAPSFYGSSRVLRLTSKR